MAGDLLWWQCCHGHVFAAPPVPPGGELHCPVLEEGPGQGMPCGTSFLFAPFATEGEARRGPVATGRRRWAPWVP